MFYLFLFVFFSQMPAYEMRISDWSSDVCSSDLQGIGDKDLAGHGAERRKADCDYRMPLPVFRPEFSLNSGPEFSLDRCFAGDRHDQNIAGQRSGTDRKSVV